MATDTRTRRNKVFGIREKHTVVKCAEILEDLSQRYIKLHTELLEAYDLSEGLEINELLEEQFGKSERELEKMEAEIKETVADVCGAILGLTPEQVIGALRRRSYAEASARLKNKELRVAKTAAASRRKAA